MRLATLLVAVALLATPLAPATASGEKESHGSVNNHPPRVIQVEGLPDEVVPVAGGGREITFSFMAKDANGWQDIVRAEVVLYSPDNDTYLREANVTGVSGGSGASHWFNATFVMWYYEMPTAGENYTLHIRVLDQTGSWSPPHYAEFEYAEISAIQIVTTSDDGSTGNDTGENTTNGPALGFGGAEPGESSSTDAVTIRNTGNVVVDIELYGTDLFGPDGHTIPVSAVRYDLVTSEMGNESALTHEPIALTSFDLPPGEDSERPIWWRLVVPTGDEQYVPAGTYDGSVTVNAIAS